MRMVSAYDFCIMPLVKIACDKRIFRQMWNIFDLVERWAG